MRTAGWLGIGCIAAALVACAPGPASPPPAEAPRAGAPAAASAAKPAAAPSAAEAAPPAALEKVVFSLTGVSANFAPHVVALHRGFFREEGLDVQMPTMRANLVTAAMLAGEVDYSSSTTATVRNALAGTPMRLIGVTVTRSTRRIMAAPPITSVEQLRGQTIAVNSIGGGPQNSAILGLEQLGINSDEVTWIPAGAGNELFLALQQGAARAGVFGGPEIPRAEAAGLNTVVRLDELVQLPESGISTSVAKLETQPDQVRRTLRALVRALAYVKTNREGTLPPLMQHLDAAREDAAEAYDAALPGFGDDGTLSQQSLRYTIDAEKRQLQIADDVPAAAVADFAPLYDALRDLGITPAPTSAR